MATSSVFSGSITADSLSLVRTGTQVVGGRMFSSIADSAAVTIVDAGGTTPFSTTYSLPANTLVSGSTLRIRVVARVTTVTAVSTAQIALRLGGATIGLSQAAAAALAAGSRCVTEAVLTARGAPGAAVGLSGVSTTVWSGLTGVVTTFPGSGNPSVPTFATNGALVVDAALIFGGGGGSSGAVVVEELVVYVD